MADLTSNLHGAKGYLPTHDGWHSRRPSLLRLLFDDILIFSGDPNEHLQHLRVVLKRLHNNGLVVRQDKCQFGATSVEFLGHKISPTGVSPLPSKVDAVSRFPPPTTIKGLQEFVGMVNYYHRFLSKIAHIMEPLYNSLAGKPKKLEWGPEQQKAFETTKIALASATTLTFHTRHSTYPYHRRKLHCCWGSR
ncbi:hypothetical protein C7M84_018262 [Penaeus vannamei]|uniref:RNA-directed DNA polymerase n=1 Tax=Penaeus vannamei TaxID=6689 RepID=A0A3R7QZX5_PENVA|nr:hypothetical protein C7M84_018262 [Penaeus vannamei]